MTYPSNLRGGSGLSRYAETHYKFRLPWSPLWRPRPEAIVDAPSLVLAGRTVPLFLAVHDAHRFPRILREVRVVVRAGGELHQVRSEPGTVLDRPFHFVDLPWPGPEIPGVNLVDVSFELEDSRGRRRRFLNHDLPGLPPTSLTVRRLATDRLPAGPGWISGDLHCHTTWSEDPVEWGGDVRTMRRAAAAMGLDFFSANDHSYDFAWDHPDWMSPADPEKRFESFRAAMSDGDDEGLPPALACEEVSCGNHAGQNVHLIVCEHPRYIPGQGDGGRRWLDNRPDMVIAEVLDHAATSGAPSWAAHPRAPMGWVQRKVFRRGSWETPDLDERLCGLQFWNGRRGSDFTEGRAQWVRSLLRGSSFLPLAGNDAHGDLNRATQVRTPLWSLRQTSAHRFGHARTWLPAADPSSRNRSGIRALLAARPPAVLSDGPWLRLRVPGAAHPEVRAEGAELELEWADIDDGEGLSRLRAYVHKIGSDREELVLDHPLEGSREGSRRVALPRGTDWVRAELDGPDPRVGNGQRSKAVTSAIRTG